MGFLAVSWALGWQAQNAQEMPSRLVMKRGIRVSRMPRLCALLRHPGSDDW
jgi:hypothetical protein